MLRIGEVSTTSFPGPTERVGENPGNEVKVSNDVIQTIKKTRNDTHITTQFHGIGSLRASRPIWASKAIRGEARERAAKLRGAEPLSRLLSRASRGSTFHDIPMKSLLASYGVDSFFHIGSYSYAAWCPPRASRSSTRIKSLFLSRK